MKIEKILRAAALFTSLAMSLSSCFENEDPGPIQEQEKEYSVVDFDRLEVRDALNVTVVQGSSYSIKVKGDRRNIDDLEVKTIGTTLRLKYDNDGRPDNRQYTTFITITMPSLSGVSFSGAVNSSVTGFTSDDLDLQLSGASKLDIAGSAKNLGATLSGASELRAFGLETETAMLEASGASKIEVLATQKLDANASGASKIRYRGNPLMNVRTSGASVIEAD